MYDFIGDIHGHADKLEELLKKLGYLEKDNGFSHPHRKAFFIGDYIDRGPKIKQTLEIVKAMVGSNNAIALMGNHEYNAICFHMENKRGGNLRKHLIKNVKQHYQTLAQFQNEQQDYDNYIEWFKTLPLFYKGENFNAVHACWNDKNISYLATALNNGFTTELIEQSVIKGTELYKAIDETLKGKEIRLPNGISFKDKDGAERHKIRVKWWEDPSDTTYNNISVAHLGLKNDFKIDPQHYGDKEYYHSLHKPVFFGHYWLEGIPNLFRENICCLDYSVAKDGVLCAYRFDGEKQLDVAKMVFV